MRLLLTYLKKNRVIYAVISFYFFALLGNSVGINIWLPSCPIYSITGIECLGCGINHAAIALLSGNLSSAMGYNPLILIYITLITGWIGFDFYKFYVKHKPSNYERH